MNRPASERVARAFIAAQIGKHLLTVAEDAVKMAKQGHRVRVAGEVRFIKDKSGDQTEWAWNAQAPSEREMGGEFEFNVKNLVPLTRTLRSILSALGFAMSGYTTFTKTKSSHVSPDGNLGGRGYIMKIPDLRRQLMNCIEVLSSVSDTLHDEINASHWLPQIDDAPGKRERREVQDIMQDV